MEDKTVDAREKIKIHRRFNILSLDGGDVRGVVSSALTTRILVDNPKFLRDVDLIAGVSTGSVQALILAASHSPQQNKGFSSLLAIHDAFRRNDALRKVLQSQFGDMKLGELKKKVVIPTFQLDSGPNTKYRSWKLKVFHNFSGEDSDSDERVVDVAMRATAFPVALPSVDGYIDGGVVSNNPSMIAIAQALDSRAGKTPLDRIRLLSVGGGFSAHWQDVTGHDWGSSLWEPNLLLMGLEGTIDMVHFQCKQLLGWSDSYFRINPVLSAKIKIDDRQTIPELVEIVENVDLEKANVWIGKNWK